MYKVLYISYGFVWFQICFSSCAYIKFGLYRNCHACVGKCKPGSIFASGLYDSYTPRKTFFISEDLRRHTFQKWGDKEKAMLENSGGMNVPLNDVLREVGTYIALVFV